jgi:uncharacterized protein
MDRVPPYPEDNPPDPSPPPVDLPIESPPSPGLHPEGPPPSAGDAGETLFRPNLSPEAPPPYGARIYEVPPARDIQREPPPQEAEEFRESRLPPYDDTPAATNVPPPPPPPPVAERAPGPLSPQDERTWAMLAHLSVLANLVTGFLGPVAALVIYLIYKDRSRYVAYHSLQSFVFQLVFWVGGGALIGIIWAVTGLLSAVIVGLLCIPFAILGTIIFAAMPVIAVIYGIIGGIQTSAGQDFRYWLVGDWVRSTLMG